MFRIVCDPSSGSDELQLLVMVHKYLSCAWLVLWWRMPPLWSSGQFLATDTEVPGSIPGATRFSE